MEVQSGLWTPQAVLKIDNKVPFRNMKLFVLSPGSIVLSAKIALAFDARTQKNT